MIIPINAKKFLQKHLDFKKKEKEFVIPNEVIGCINGWIEREFHPRSNSSIFHCHNVIEDIQELYPDLDMDVVHKSLKVQNLKKSYKDWEIVIFDEDFTTLSFTPLNR